MTITRVPSSSPYAGAIGFSAAAATDQLIFTAGFSAVDAEGNIVGPADAYAQTVEVLRKLTATLEQAGANATHVVQTRIYLVDAADWEAVGLAHGQVFADVNPAATMVVVAGLLDPRMLVEIEAVATRPAQHRD